MPIAANCKVTPTPTDGVEGLIAILCKVIVGAGGVVVLVDPVDPVDPDELPLVVPAIDPALGTAQVG